MTGQAGGRRLVLLRHAKAEPAGSVADELRSLAVRGRQQCAGVGAGMAASGLLPEHVLVSSAVRTRQTWELLRAALGDVPAPEVEVTDLVYHARVADIVAAAQAVDGRVRTVLVVGHEPTMSATAAYLAGDGDPTDLAQVGTGLPTAGYAVLAVDTWPGLDRGSARLLDVVRPAL